LPSDLLQRRPDILQAEQTMVSANAEIGVAIANFFPTVGLSALYGSEASTTGNLFKNDFSVWNIVGNVSGPLFQRGRLLEQYEEQKAFWDEMIAQYQATIIQAFREVSDALAAEAAPDACQTGGDHGRENLGESSGDRGDLHTVAVAYVPQPKIRVPIAGSRSSYLDRSSRVPACVHRHDGQFGLVVASDSDHLELAFR
jgi:hypothetical protein